MIVSFELARETHAQAIAAMRIASGAKLAHDLGPGKWSGTTRLPAVRERIRGADPQNLRAQTIYVCCRDGEALGSVVVSTFLPSFLKGKLWRQPKASALGVFNLVVHPAHQRQGLGRLLMAGVEELAGSHGIPFIRLDAFEASPGATAFYRALGYDERATVTLRTTRLVLFEKAADLPTT